MKAYTTYLENLKNSKQSVKAFLDNKTMLTGRITDFDDSCVIVNKCMVMREKLVSITPE